MSTSGEGRNGAAALCFVCLLVFCVAGCDVTAIPMPNPAQFGQGQGSSPVKVIDKSKDTSASDLIDADSIPLADTPLFEIWGAGRRGIDGKSTQFYLDLNYLGKLGAAEQLLVVIDSPSHQFQANLIDAVTSGTAGRLTVPVHSQVHRNPEETIDFFIVMVPDGSGSAGTRVSNVYSLRGIDRKRDRIASDRPPSPPLGGLRIGSKVDRAWESMAKDHQPGKIAVIKLTDIEGLDVSEKLNQTVDSLRLGETELDSSVVVYRDAAAAVLAPVEDIDALAAKIDFGSVADVDTTRRIVEVAADASLFPKNVGAIAEDRTHVDYFLANAQILRGDYKLPDSADGWSSYAFRDTKDNIVHKAIARLNREDPEKCTDADVREKIIRAYQGFALDKNLTGTPRRDAIQGYANWGGEKSVLDLIYLLQENADYFRADREVASTSVQVLGELGDARAIEPLARMLADTSFGRKAVEKREIARALTKIGPAAEDIMKELAPNNDPEVSRLSIQVLGDIGTDKSISLLRQATKSSNPTVRFEAERAIDKIKGRREDAES